MSVRTEDLPALGHSNVLEMINHGKEILTGESGKAFVELAKKTFKRDDTCYSALNELFTNLSKKLV